MDIMVLARGLAIGLAVATPVGAIGFLCIRRTLADGRLVGFLSGLGAATADAIYGAVAAMGITSISSVLVAQQSWIRLVGGLCLCYIAVRTATARPALETVARPVQGRVAAYGSTFVLTLANPSTILSFAAVFAGFGLVDDDVDRPSAVLLVLGVFFGSALWWLLLCGAVGFVRHRMTLDRLRWVNRLSGVTLAVFGVLALLGV